MPCKPMFDENGKIIGISCSRGNSSRQKCHICGKPVVSLCDFPLNSLGDTCDKAMCREHTHNIGEDLDVCDKHNNDMNIQKTLKYQNCKLWQVKVQFRNGAVISAKINGTKEDVEKYYAKGKVFNM